MEFVTFVYINNLVVHNRRLRSARYYLEKDRKDKFQALDIDNTCAGLTNQTGGIHYAKNVVKIETE